MRRSVCAPLAVFMLTLFPSAGSVFAAPPTADQALRLEPIQKDAVDYEIPTEGEIKTCTIKVEKFGNGTGWVVRGPMGQTLRQFIDTNGDNKVDCWCYFKDGIEVYRDLDSDFNEKADQYRWFQFGGTRWGVDKNEDGRIDSWHVISAEEVAAEVVEALKTRDTGRFGRLLITEAEMKELGMSPSQIQEIEAKLSAAPTKFRTISSQQRSLNNQTTFLNFGATKPGIVPAGVGGSKKDILVYENAAAMCETGGRHHQVFLGSIVRVGNVWRLVDTPQLPDGDEIASSGFFFQASLNRRDVPTGETGGEAPDTKTQQVMAELDRIDREIAKASPKERTTLQRKRFSLLEGLAANAEDAAGRAMWMQQLVDTLSASVQSGIYPEGMERLQALENQFSKSAQDRDLLAYVTFRRLSAGYSLDLQAPKANFNKVQEKWLENLEGFVSEFPGAPDAAEAMLQLAVAQEFAGEDDKSLSWYGKILQDFPSSSAARKAQGAKTRLESVGKRISIQGPGVNGERVSLDDLRGKTVLIQYWATWCEPCKNDMAQIKQLLAKYGNRKFAVLGVNLDNDRTQLVNYLKRERLPWLQVCEPGGLDGRLANEMGILTLPTMILVDPQGQVLSRNITVMELEAELKKLP